jgi:hypothetical protein
VFCSNIFLTGSLSQLSLLRRAVLIPTGTCWGRLWNHRCSEGSRVLWPPIYVRTREGRPKADHFVRMWVCSRRFKRTPFENMVCVARCLVACPDWRPLSVRARLLGHAESELPSSCRRGLLLFRMAATDRCYSNYQLAVHIDVPTAIVSLRGSILGLALKVDLSLNPEPILVRWGAWGWCAWVPLPNGSEAMDELLQPQ